MFKKLKDKIAEEVKQSPLKSVQQFAQAVVSPTSSSVFEPSSSDDKFCIEEGDIEEDKTSSKEPSGGFTSVALTGQSSPPVRGHGSRGATADIENLFPVFESQTTHFHVQSDWESASEVEDRGQFDHISKENLYDAYRKVYGRYNKMKNKYHELVTHYRQLERENEKAKNVLSETQDKALLRVSELREQCLLEQQAKAHLEEALRNELEEKDHIISSLNTKVQYLKTVNDVAASDMKHLPGHEVDNLIDFTENTCVSKVPSPFVASSKVEMVEWLDERLKSCKQFLMDRTTKVENLKSQLEKLKNTSINVRPNKEEETETCDGDNLFALETVPQVDNNVYESIVSVVNQFSKEVKVIQETTKSFMFVEDVYRPLDQESSFVKSHAKPLSGIASEDKEFNLPDAQVKRADKDLDSYINNAKEVCDLHDDELKKLHQTISEYEIKSESINQKLLEERKNTEHLQRKVIELNKIVDFVKTQLKVTNELCEKDNFNIDKLNLTQHGENDLIINLNSLISNFMSTKSELESFKSAKVNLENELQTTKDELDFLKMNENSRVDRDENQKFSQDESLLVVNNELKEQLERLHNENKNRLAQKETLHLEMNGMKEINKKLEVRIGEMKVLLDSSEKQCHKNNEELNKIKFTFGEQKKVLQDHINRLNVELENTKKEINTLLNLKELSSNKLTSLEEENRYIITEKQNLQLQIEELKTQYKQYEQQYLTLKTLNSSMSEELISLKEECNIAISDKSAFIENINKLENLLKDFKDGLTKSKKENEMLEKELVLMKTNKNNIFTEKYESQKKIEQLENEIKKVKEECSSISCMKDNVSKESFSLKQQNDSLISEKKDLNEQINKLVLVIDNRMKDYSRCVEEKEKLFVDIVNLREDYDVISTEKDALKTKLAGFETEMVQQKSKYDNLMILNKQLSEEMCVLKKTVDEIDKQKSELQIRIVELENKKTKSNNFEADTRLLLNNLDSIKTELDQSKQEHETATKNFSIEITSLNKYRDESEKEKKALQIVIDNLHAKINTREAEYSSYEESKEKLINELSVLQMKHSNLIKEKETILKELKNLDEEVQNYKLEIASSVKISDDLSTKIQVLTQDVLEKSKEKDILQTKFDNLIQQCNQDNIRTVKDENTKLNNEIILIQTQYKELVSTLNNTKEQLQSEQESCAKLNDQLQALQESFKNKCNDIEEQENQSIQLKNNVANLTKQLNQINESLDSIKNERDYLSNNVAENITTVRNLRKVHLKLFDFVSNFKEEITLELNNIKLKISNELMHQVNTALKASEDCNKQIIELEYKSKKDIDSYNSKIKNLQSQLQNDDVTAKCNLPILQHLNIQQLGHVSNPESLFEKETDLEKKLHELQGKLTVYKSKCNDLEISLNRAVSIMKSIHSFLISRFDNFMLKEQGLIVQRKGEKIIETEENVCILRQQQIAAIESFVKEYQSRILENENAFDELNCCLENKIDDNLSSCLDKNFAEDGTVRSHIDLENDTILSESNDFNQHEARKEVDDVSLKTKSSKVMSQMDNNSLEIQQLKNEVKLKEDIIKKLQYVIEEYEQGNHRLVKCKENTYNISDAKMENDLVTRSGIEDKNVTIINSERYNRLERENGILIEKLETMKHTHEENMKQLSAAFEHKFKDSEEIIKHNENEKSGKERKFILDEMKEQIENMQHDLDERGDAFEKLYEDHQQLKKSKDAELSQLRSNYEKEMREQDKKWRSCLDRKLAEEESRHKEEMNALTSEWATQRKELQTASQLAMSVVGSGSNSSDLLRHQVQSLTLQLEQLQNERCGVWERCKSPVPARTIQDCTEMEYLRNILYDYMMGKEPVVLAKVLCALMKFSEHQTNNIVNKEEQRLTLLGQLGIL